MKVIKRNIWDYWENHPIVIPINGFIKKNGELVMGAGLALQVKEKFPFVPKELGKEISQFGLNVIWWDDKRFQMPLIFFPVKFNWWEKADLSLINQSARTLKKQMDLSCSNKCSQNLKVVLSKVGCGNGKLDWKTEVEPILDKWFDDRFIVIDLK